MKLTRAELEEVLGILEKIDAGRNRPRVGDRIGRFFRQYESGHRDVTTLLAVSGFARRSDGAVSGTPLGAIEAHAILEPEVDVIAYPLGEVAGTLVVSEQLGGVLNVRMWLKARAANRAFNLLRDHLPLQLEGDYRWTPIARLTLGEAIVNKATTSLPWTAVRSLKAVADDLFRPPHALEYILDYRLGPPGLKFFRAIAARKRLQTWEALPALEEAKAFEVDATHVKDNLTDGLFFVLAFREPWTSRWTIVNAIEVEPKDVFAHAIAWADFQRELVGLEFDNELIGGIRDALRSAGILPLDLGDPLMTRSLLPGPRDIVRSLRGSS